jgi:Cu-Zn family superoxide dismutase
MKAVCVLTNNNPGISGHIFFKELNNGKLSVSVDIKGLKPGLHGIHIHNKGNLLEGCESLCSHFNPYSTEHGSQEGNIKNRHVGDLGNILANKDGITKEKFIDNYIKLKGKCNIIGRSVVIHENCDDLGLGGLDDDGNIINKKKYKESIKTGNAGKRIACGVIGWD